MVKGGLYLWWWVIGESLNLILGFVLGVDVGFCTWGLCEVIDRL